ncbi:hypothetical protein KCTCHS21_11470 [Cohnella abietis]|uniref:Uncharacterized protein n=1 Tax=Cohnella abietis TaxID=2507935 RepID=A0A3T1D109_9BACL|nr:hypothetical protein KCTCHS21_11470 [Cohnella abietis]
MKFTCSKLLLSLSRIDLGAVFLCENNEIFQLYLQESTVEAVIKKEYAKRIKAMEDPLKNENVE